MKKNLLVLSLSALLLVSCGNAAKSEQASVAPSGEQPSVAPSEGTSEQQSEQQSEQAAKEFPLLAMGVADAVQVAEDAEDYDKESAEVYNANLGAFFKVYEAARAEQDIDKRYAEMAVAEAKLLESGVMFPLTADGGGYGISRIVPGSGSSVSWGLDSDRVHTMLIVEGNPIKAADRAELRAKYNQTKGQGTYYDWAKTYLAGKGYTLKDTYSRGYNTDPKTWDILGTARAADSRGIVNCVDFLVQYDNENRMQPALAESWTVSDDGLKYTFTLREDAKWVKQDGSFFANVKADDFVAGLQHVCDAAGGNLGYLIAGYIKNGAAYLKKQITDFNEVGVKAVDDRTVEYTLEQPVPYFTTMLTYNPYAPMNREFYVSKGGKFGSEFKQDETYNYGKTENDILSCGAYVVSSHVDKNSINFAANESYYNKAAVAIKTVNWRYNDGKDPVKTYTDMKNGDYDSVGLTPENLVKAKEDGWFEQYAFVGATTATSFMGFLNLNRNSFANFDDAAKMVSPKTDDQKAAAKKAMANYAFRLGLLTSLDRETYNAQTDGEDLALINLRNTYTPGDFVSLSKAVTVKINGADREFPKGTKYGAILQAQLDADKFPVLAFDIEKEDGTGSTDGYDGWYNPEVAEFYFGKAVEQLAAAGVVVNAENPIVLDLPAYGGSPAYKNRAEVLKRSIEQSSKGLVKVNVVLDNGNGDDWYNAGYYTEIGEDANYDIYDVSGWGPDYGDPSTYLDTFLPEYEGYMIKSIGIF